MRIRSVLRAISLFVIVLGICGTVLSLIERDGVVAIVTLMGLVIVAGILWMLAEISEQLAELPEDLANARSTSSTASDAATQKLPQQHASPSQAR